MIAIIAIITRLSFVCNLAKYNEKGIFFETNEINLAFELLPSAFNKGMLYSSEHHLR